MHTQHKADEAVQNPQNKNNPEKNAPHRVSVRNFNHLALCSKDGCLEMLNGSQIQLVDPESFFESLRNNEKKTVVGRDPACINGFIAKPLFISTLFYGLKKYMGIEEAQEQTGKDTVLEGRRIPLC